MAALLTTGNSVHHKCLLIDQLNKDIQAMLFRCWIYIYNKFIVHVSALNSRLYGRDLSDSVRNII